jgi:hypothetical protein
MLNNIQAFIQFFVPDKIEDVNQNVINAKLATGIIFGFFLVAIAFAILTGAAQVVVEEFGAIKVTNATIFVLLGVFFVWLTLTKVGVKK